MVMKRLVAAVLFLFACTNEEDAQRTLRVSGYKNIQMTGYAWMKCGDREGTCTGFRATAPNGEIVEGAVSCSIGGCTKGCTIRL